MQKVIIQRLSIISIMLLCFNFTDALSQPVVDLDNWFNHETKKDSGNV